MIDHIGFGAFHFARIEARNGAFTGPCANIFRRVQIFQMACRMAGIIALHRFAFAANDGARGGKTGAGISAFKAVTGHQSRGGAAPARAAAFGIGNPVNGARRIFARHCHRQ